MFGYDFTPAEGGGAPIHEDVRYELEQFPADKTEKDLERHVAPAIRAHMKNFLECIETRALPVSDIEQGYMSTSACILANISQKLGRSLAWDHAKGVVIGDDEATRLLRREYPCALAASRRRNGVTSRRAELQFGRGARMPSRRTFLKTVAATSVAGLAAPKPAVAGVGGRRPGAND